MKVTIGQYNPKIADCASGLVYLKNLIAKAEQEKSEFIVLPELFLGGYPPKDLLFTSAFQAAISSGFQEIQQLSVQTSIPIAFGAPSFENGKIFNTGYIFHQGKILLKQHKTLLPSYGVFDEKRYFTKSNLWTIAQVNGQKVGLLICEDAWYAMLPGVYEIDPIEKLAPHNPDIILHLCASPFDTINPLNRRKVAISLSQKFQATVIQVNQVGLQDDLLFDGQSVVVTPSGEIHSAPAFEVSSLTFDSNVMPSNIAPISNLELIYKGVVLAISDYVEKSGFQKVVLGLSGGIDSALCATLAVAALGKDNVVGLLMPSPYSSTGSISDAQALAQNLGIETFQLGIHTLFADAQAALGPIGDLKSITQENLQSRIRGLLLMGYSNQKNALVLATGNKSELAVGYCTLYGDMNGALCPLGDLYKTQVYALSQWINLNFGELIPQNSITKPPSAELKPGQKDQDTLPDYDVLDTILALMIEKQLSAEEIAKQGFAIETVNWIAMQVRRNEYKRRQAGIIPRVSPIAFGSGRRIPILRI